MNLHHIPRPELGEGITSQAVVDSESNTTVMIYRKAGVEMGLALDVKSGEDYPQFLDREMRIVRIMKLLTT